MLKHVRINGESMFSLEVPGNNGVFNGKQGIFLHIPDVYLLPLDFARPAVAQILHGNLH